MQWIRKNDTLSSKLLLWVLIINCFFCLACNETKRKLPNNKIHAPITSQQSSSYQYSPITKTDRQFSDDKNHAENPTVDRNGEERVFVANSNQHVFRPHEIRSSFPNVGKICLPTLRGTPHYGKRRLISPCQVTARDRLNALYSMVKPSFQQDHSHLKYATKKRLASMDSASTRTSEGSICSKSKFEFQQFIGSTIY